MKDLWSAWKLDIVAVGSREESVFGLSARFCAPFNVSGLPAASIPGGMSTEKMPIGLQIIGRPFDDATVLRVADAYERHTRWHLEYPRSDPLLTTSGALPAPELGHFVPIAAHRIATPLAPMILRGVVENQDTGIGVGATAQILKFCRHQKLGYRSGKNRQSQLPALEQLARSMQMKTSFALYT